MKLVYNVYDDDHQIESKQFDNFPEALAYAKNGLITFICEEDLDCPDCEERVVWTWDSTWDDEEAIANVESKGEEQPETLEEQEDFIEINISGPADKITSLAELVFDDVFDINWDTPVEDQKVENQDFEVDFGYNEEPVVTVQDIDFDNPFEDDLYYSSGEDEFEVGEPEIVADLQDSEEDQEEKLEVGEPFEDPESESDKNPEYHGEEKLLEDVEELEDLEDEEIDESDEEEISDEELEEILLNIDSVKDIAAEAGEEVAEVVKENPEVESEEIREITDEVVDEAIEEMEEVSEEEFEEVEENEDNLKEETHNQYAKPEGDKVKAYNNALRYAKQNNADYIYGYTNHAGKFFALEQPIKMSNEPGKTEKEFRNKYKNCSTVFVAYPDKAFIKEAIPMTRDELLDKEGTDNVDLINAGRPEEERVELVEETSDKFVFYYNLESGEEKVIEKQNIKPSEIRAEVNRLIEEEKAIQVHVSKFVGGQEFPLDKYTYDPEWTPGTPEYLLRNSKDFALESLDESISQELNKAYSEISKAYGKDLNELLYGPEGFMTLNYPNGFEDFKGDIIYSEKYWTEFEKWLEENNKLDDSNIEDQEDDLTDREFAEQLQERLLQEVDLTSRKKGDPVAPSVLNNPSHEAIRYNVFYGDYYVARATGRRRFEGNELQDTDIICVFKYGTVSPYEVLDLMTVKDFKDLLVTENIDYKLCNYEWLEDATAPMTVKRHNN